MLNKSGLKILKKHYIKNTNLLKYLFLRLFDFIIFILKTVLLMLLPFIIFVFCTILIIFCNLEANFTESLLTTLFSTAVAFYLAIVGLLLTLLFSKNEFFKTKLISVFFNVKMFGFYPVISAVVVDTFYLGMSIYYLLAKMSLNIFIGSMSSIIYSVIIFIFAFLFLTKDDEKRYFRFLKNNGVFKKKKKSQLIRENLLFGIKHPNYSKFCLKINLLSNVNAVSLNINIPDSIEDDIKFKKSWQYKDKVKLLCYYLENYSCYIQTDFDVMHVITFYENINAKVINPLIDAGEYALVKQLYLSSSIFLKNFHSSSFCKVNDSMYEILKEIDLKDLPDKQLYANFMIFFLFHLSNRSKLSSALLGSLNHLKKIKTKDSYFKSIQKYIIPLFEKIDTKKIDIKSILRDLNGNLEKDN